MCGRYYIEISDTALKELIEDITRRMGGQSPEQLTFKLSGEIYPTDIVPVITNVDKNPLMRWGFSGFAGPRGGKARPIINARSETVLEKPTFRRPVLERRCLVPASGYYEWQKQGTAKVKHRLYSDTGPLLMAGCFRYEGGDEGQEALPRFVILTQPAAPSIAAIHDRMPVIFTSDTADLWLEQGAEALSRSLTELSFAAA